METAGVPTYDELVVATRDDADPGTVKRFLAALEDGTRSLARDQAAGVGALLRANPELDPKLQRASVKVTLPYFLPPPGKRFGYMDRAAWRRFTSFMHAHGLLKLATPAGAMTNAYLP
jgi:ABC-type nitrate/sulfonate/bicarbonate transport system substrate-binding protein